MSGHTGCVKTARVATRAKFLFGYDVDVLLQVVLQGNQCHADKCGRICRLCENSVAIRTGQRFLFGYDVDVLFFPQAEFFTNEVYLHQQGSCKVSCGNSRKLNECSDARAALTVRTLICMGGQSQLIR
jgi:hypothetical protein